MSNIIQRKVAIRFGPIVGEMAIRIWQAEENAPVLFCLPGYIGHIGSEYTFLADHLSGNGYTVIVPDIIGRGDSTYFGNVDVYSPKNMLMTIHALFSAFPGRPRFVIGTSWGGVMAVFYIQAFRERFDGVILNDIPLINYGPNEEFRARLIEMCGAEFDTWDEAAKWGYDVLDRTLGPLPDHLDAEFFGKNYVRQVGDRYRYKIDPVLADVIKQTMSAQFDLTNTIAAIPSPVALLFGAESWHRDAAAINFVRKNGSDVTVFDSLAGKHPPLLATRDQHMIVQGFMDYATKKAQPWKQTSNA